MTEGSFEEELSLTLDLKADDLKLRLLELDLPPSLYDSNSPTHTSTLIRFSILSHPNHGRKNQEICKIRQSTAVGMVKLINSKSTGKTRGNSNTICHKLTSLIG
jgi:hypothetical protein